MSVLRVYTQLLYYLIYYAYIYVCVYSRVYACVCVCVYVCIVLYSPDISGALISKIRALYQGQISGNKKRA